MNFKIKTIIATCIIMLVVLTSCKDDDGCICDGLFRYPDGTELIVPDVDCDTGEPGAPPMASLPPIEASYLGCHSTDD